MQNLGGLLYNNGMNKTSTFLVFAFTGLGTLFFVIGPILAKSGFLAQETPAEQGASVFFIESSKPEIIKQTLAMANTNPNSRRLRILLVPGHDNEFWGTQFRGLKESVMTLELGKRLLQLLISDGEFEVITSRDEEGYNPNLASYFSSEKSGILEFAKGKKQIMNDLISDGKLSTKTDGVYHNDAPSHVVVRLYGINKWANENNIDLVVHLHFNDYPRKNKSAAGKYSGFSIYVPERQYSNSRASKAVADEVFKQLKVYYSESNMPKESVGVVEDQDLIAIGSFNTLDPASILIEYGYVYESQFLEKDVRTKVIQDLATQTYIGIRNFLGGSVSNAAGKFNTAFLPHTWLEPLATGVRNSPSVLSLQAALILEGLYPPEGRSKRDCPLTGTFGKCTELSLASFQQKYGLADEPGKLGEDTLKKLNELYGE